MYNPEKSNAKLLVSIFVILILILWVCSHMFSYRNYVSTGEYAIDIIEDPTFLIIVLLSIWFILLPLAHKICCYAAQESNGKLHTVFRILFVFMSVWSLLAVVGYIFVLRTANTSPS